MFAKKHMKTSCGHTKKGLNDLCGRKFVDKSCRNSFSGKFGKIRAKFLRIPKKFLLLHLWWKGTSAPLPPFWKDRGGNALAMTPFVGVPVHIILHALFTRCRLQCASVMNKNYISGILRQSSSWLQKYPATHKNRRKWNTQCHVSSVHNCKNTRLRDWLVE